MNFIHQLMTILLHVTEWVISVVIVKMIVARWLAEKLLTATEKRINKNQRYLLIWRHYLEQAKGLGHKAEHVLTCQEVGCSTL